MICEYTIRITGNYDILVLSPQIIRTLSEKIRCSDTKELIIPADELFPQGYAEYLERVMQTNNIEKNIGRKLTIWKTKKIRKQLMFLKPLKHVLKH